MSLWRVLAHLVVGLLIGVALARGPGWLLFAALFAGLVWLVWAMWDLHRAQVRATEALAELQRLAARYRQP